MNVLLTGASSFSGLWLARGLAQRGARVTAPLHRPLAAYDQGPRAERVRALRDVAEVIPNITFGDPAFLKLAEASGCDVLCHHAAHVGDYRNPDFDVADALAQNTRGFRALSDMMKARGFRAVIATGSAFEPDEGAGEFPLKAFSPYGLSKAFTSATLRYWCDLAGLPFGKFVIANPFGPFEEPRFCAYLMKSWAQGQTPQVRTPDYVRDNIHAQALGLAYAAFVTDVATSGVGGRLAPSMYVESQGAFAERFAREIGRRIDKPCLVERATQTDFSEPFARLNVDRIDYPALGFDEAAAWDAIADYYAERLFLRSA